jgi:hypothetical protein
MVALNLSLHPSASNIIHGVLTCFARISDTVSFEARREHVNIITRQNNTCAYGSSLQ